MRVADGADVGAAVGAGGVKAGVERAAGVGVGLGVGAGVGLAVGAGVGFAVGAGVGLGVGPGVDAGGAEIVTVPPAIVPLNLLVSAASKLKLWAPTGSFVAQEWGTPCFQFEVPSRVIAWGEPSMITETWSGAVPLRFR